MAAKVDTKKCTGCGQCVDVCPVQAIRIEAGKDVVADDCVECGACLNACGAGALSM